MLDSSSDEESVESLNNINKLIHKYFSMGLQHTEILSFLQLKHNIIISSSTLKRRLKNLKLYRRKNYTSISDLSNYLENLIGSSSQLHGYRWLHMKCLQNNLVTTQNTIRELLKVIDPVGVHLRKKNKLRRRQYYSKGPNFLWHIDCYDKLKPYGICISGCIDGFSRFVVWLECSSNTSKPGIIARYYIKIVKELGGCPRVLRADLGTENSHVAQLQTFLFNNTQDNNYSSTTMPAFLYGVSPNNQRIEAWWCMLRKHAAQFWMNIFQQLKDDGHFSGSFLDKSLIQFCFLKIIQKELSEVVKEWNSHRIRKSKSAISPSGRPIIMYELPELYGTENYLCKLTNAVIDICNEEYLQEPDNSGDEDVSNLCNIIMDEKQLTRPTEPYEALNLYITLRNEILYLIHN